MQTWIIEIMESYGYIGILFLIAVENLFPPIPSEVILTFGGFMTTYTKLTVIGVIWFSTLGSLVGAVILYGCGYLINADKLEKFVNRWGHILRVKIEDINKAEVWFQKYGSITVFFCRFIPLIRSLISIPAGMAKLNFPIFFLYTLLGTLIWNTVLVYIGSVVGESWTTIVEWMDIYSNFVYVGLIIVFIIGVIYFTKIILKRR